MQSQPEGKKSEIGKTSRNNDCGDSCSSTQVTCPLLLEATSVGPTAVRSLKQGGIGKVHSIFTRVVNVLTSDNRLLSVVGRDVGNGPINIVINLPQSTSLTSIGIRKDDEVLNVKGTFVLGKNLLCISTKNAKEWRPQRVFGGKVLAIKRIRENLLTMKEVACAHGCFGGMAQLIEWLGEEDLEKLADKKLNPFARRGLPHLSTLIETIKAGDYRKIERSAKELVGLGPGLTPSADDVLSGLMVSLTLMSENLNICADMVSETNKSIISCIEGRTTLISQEFLTHAAAGEANESILALIEKMLTAGPNEVEDATKHVLAIGEASGTDVVLGIFLGSQLLLDEVSCAGKRF